MTAIVMVSRGRSAKATRDLRWATESCAQARRQLSCREQTLAQVTSVGRGCVKTVGPFREVGSGLLASGVKASQVGAAALLRTP
jgi:hypothetical protein